MYYLQITVSLSQFLTQLTTRVIEHKSFVLQAFLPGCINSQLLLVVQHIFLHDFINIFR